MLIILFCQLYFSIALFFLNNSSSLFSADASTSHPNSRITLNNKSLSVILLIAVILISFLISSQKTRSHKILLSSTLSIAVFIMSLAVSFLFCV